MNHWQFYRHMPVYTLSGSHLGRVEEIGHGVEYLHIQQGHVLVQDWYVPLSDVRDVTPAGVFLAVDRSDLHRQQRNIPPEEYLARQGATPGYEYGSPSDLPGSGA